MGFNTGIIDGWARPVIVVSTPPPAPCQLKAQNFEICRFVWLLPRCGLKSNRRRSKATAATTAKASAKLAMRVFGIGRACYLLTGITTFSGIIDYAHICTYTHMHAHSHWKTAMRKGATFRMEDTVTHNICNCLLLTCGSRWPFGPPATPSSRSPLAT